MPTQPAAPSRAGSGRVSTQRRLDDPPRETGVAFGIPREAQIGAARIGGRIVNTAVGVDLQHERRAVLVDTEVAAAEACARLQGDEKARGEMSRSRASSSGSSTGNDGQLVVVDPLHVGVLEASPVGKAVLHRRVGLGPGGVVGVLGHEHRALDPVDVLLDQGLPELRDDLASPGGATRPVSSRASYGSARRWRSCCGA